MPTGIVSWNGVPVQYAVIPIPDPPAGAGNKLVMKGWQWWELLSLGLTIDNSGAAADCGIVLRYLVQGVNIGSFGFGVYVNSLLTAPVFAAQGLVAVQSTLKTVMTSPLPHMPAVGEGVVTVDLDGGDANTQLKDIMFTVVGHRFANRRE